jgi:NTE family protein
LEIPHFGRKGLERRVGLALGSGAARGWAHVGVIRALEEAGHEVGWVAGCSMGAVVAAAFALGRLDVLEEFARSLTPRKVLSYLDLAMPVRGLLDGDRVTELFRDLLGDQDLKDARVPLCVVATDLSTGHEVRLCEGPAAEALRASIAVPGIFAPVVQDGRYLADGGLVNPVPVDVVRALGAEVVIAVDLNTETLDGKWFEPEHPMGPEAAPGATEAAHAIALAARHDMGPDETSGVLARRYRRLEVELKEKALRWMVRSARPNIFDILGTSINIVARQITQERLAVMNPRLVIRPRVGAMSLWEFADAANAIEAGYKAAFEALKRQ